MLIAQCDDERSAEEELTEFLRVCRSFGAEDAVLAEDEQEGELLVEARRLVGPAHEARGAELVEDVCVPRARLADLLRGLREIGGRNGVLITCAGHAGEGNMHPSIVFDPDDPAATRAALRAFDEVMALGLELGGTITGEHGVGLLKRGWLAAEAGEDAMRVHRSVRDALDPHHLLNPGKVLRA
jgi:glycolate oxidase